MRVEASTKKQIRAYIETGNGKEELALQEVEHHLAVCAAPAEGARAGMSADKIIWEGSR